MKEVLRIANKCRSCAKARCQSACPLKQDISLITKLIKDNQIDEAVNILFEHNPFGYVTSYLCNHESQCAGNCVFKDVDFYEIEKTLSVKYFDKLISYPTKLENKKIAIVGGGIAGLTLAHSLLKQGIKPTIFEKNVLGGVITYAIPEFRFEKSLFFKHLQAIEENACVIYQEITLDNINILNQYDHIFFTIGAEVENRFLEEDGVLSGIDVLKSYHDNTLTISGKKIAVIGLGNTSCDVARTLKKNNNDVFIIYRRDISSSPASFKELSALKAEGIVIKECLNPVSFTNNVLKLQKQMLIPVTGSSRKNITPLDEYCTLDFDYVVEALGNKVNDQLLKAILESDYDLLVNKRKEKSGSKYFTINHNNQLISVIGDAYYGAWNIANAINSSLEALKESYPTYLFGGSFNPITKAHVEIIEYLSKLGKVIIVPNGDKYNLKELMSFEHRKKMIMLEVSKLEYFERVFISEFEKSTLYKGSIETLRYYNHPVMVIGDDCLLTLHNWINASSLVSENNFLVITRKYDVKTLEDYILNQEILKEYKDHFKVVELLEDKLKQVSSSSYRLDNNKDALTNDVLEYIKNNKLYEV